MGIRRALGDFRELHRSVVELFDDDRAAEAEASLQIAKSARRFSQNTKEVVDDKLSFSATLMRAGEVHAANRLLAEVEHDVREEEAALIETVNEVKVAQTMRRQRVTRLRLARMLAVATMGSALLTFSAAGMAGAGFLRDRAEGISRPSAEGNIRVSLNRQRDVAPTENADSKLRRLRIGEVDLLVTKQQLKALREITDGSIDPEGLDDLLDALPAPLADQIEQAITFVEAEEAKAEAEVGGIVAAPEQTIQRKKRDAKKAAAQAQQEQPREESTQDRASADDERDSDRASGDDGDSSESSEQEEGDGGPPLPVDP